MTLCDTIWNHWRLRNDIHADHLWCCNNCNEYLLMKLLWGLLQVQYFVMICSIMSILFKNWYFTYFKIVFDKHAPMFLYIFSQKQRCSSRSKISLWWVERMDVDCVIFGPVFTLKSIPVLGNISRFSDIIQGGLVGLVEISASHISNLLVLDCTEN